ncbi:UbiA family prenyltransferase [Streptomyces triculaminicus]|uniref:UbiA family prenyltransferase n=1 Tax=Streptomyces triculaminicus TaxID=2816232 RepID=UPI0033E1E8AC
MTAAVPSAWRQPPQRLAFELTLSWRFNRGDLSAGTIPGLVVTCAAWSVQAQPLSRLPWSLTRALVYFWLFLSIHTLSNQATGHTEDRVNKPWRPIPSGTVSVAGTHHRFSVATALFLGCGWFFGVFWWALMWTALVVAHNYLGSDRYWPTKNLHTILGALTQTAAAWQMTGPIQPNGWRWITAATCYWSLVFIQDLRDIDGDTAAGRRTLPMALGNQQTRLILAAGLLLLPVLAHLLLVETTPHLATAHAWEPVLAGASACIALRILLLRTPRSDRITYQLYCWTWCWILTGPAWMNLAIPRPLAARPKWCFMAPVST